MAERNVKQTILRSAIALVEECGEAHVTVRDIAARAGVGIGLINYHFGSKDELLRQCAQAAVAEELDRTRAAVKELDGLPPLERLRVMSKRNCDYMADHPELTRLSLLTDLRRGDFAGDNTARSREVFLPLVAQAGKMEPEDQWAKFRTHILIHALQAGLLRRASVQTRIGLDFYEKADRDRFVDLTIDQLFQEGV